MEKYCPSCDSAFNDLKFKICPHCGNQLKIRYGRQPIPRKLRHEVFKRDGYKCCECGATKDETSLEIDHIVPVSRGGTNDIDNLQTLCRECNRMKHTDEWIGGKTDFEVTQKKLLELEKQIQDAKIALERTNDENQILDYKFKIKKLQTELIPKLKNKINKLEHEQEVLNAKKQAKRQEQQQKDNLLKKLYLELDSEILSRLPNRLNNYFSLSLQSIENSLRYIIENFNDEDLYSFIFEYEFEKLNTTTDSIFDLGDLDVLIILKDGTNLTNWDEVTDKEDIIYISEDLTNKIDLSHRYEGLKNLKVVEILGDTSKVKFTKAMFSYCYSLIGISSLNKLDMSNVVDTTSMFEGCGSLVDISSFINWNVSKVTNMSRMFSLCVSLKNLNALKNWDVSNVENMSEMFDGPIPDYSYCGPLDLDEYNELFEEKGSLLNLNGLNKWDVANVKNMASMFEYNFKLKDISALKNWDVSNVTTFNGLFRCCETLPDVSALQNWDVSNVKDISAMLAGCSSLTNVYGMSNWNVSNVENIGYLFSGCKSLTSVNTLKNWDISNVKNNENLFHGCPSSILRNGDVFNVMKDYVELDLPFGPP